MTEFTNINGFSLYGETQTNLTINNTITPWLRIKKESNKLPIAYLTSRVFYWKLEEKVGNKYIYYSHVEQQYKENLNDEPENQPSNTYLNGRMSGFPLIRPTIDVDNDEWVLSKSINTSGNKIFETEFRFTKRTTQTITFTSRFGVRRTRSFPVFSQYYKEQGFCFPPPIKELNQEDRNIIVIDLQNIKPLNSSIGGNSDWNKYPLKYLVLRITNWEEDSTETIESKEFYSGGKVITGMDVKLVKCNYTYTCDIINPYDIYTLQDTEMSINQNQSFCDMNLNFFLINKNINGNIIYKAPWWVKKVDAAGDGLETISSDVFLNGDFDINISINPKYEDSPISQYETDEGKITLCLWNDLSNNYIQILGGNHDSNPPKDYPRLGGYSGWTTGDQFPLSSYSDVEINIDYLSDSVLNNNYGWINTITLKKEDVDNTFASAQYKMTNPLWYSLNSPRHTVVHMIGENNEVLIYKYKWMVNYTKKPLKLDGSFAYDENNEGDYTNSSGYTLNKKTIDMGRKTFLPYYCRENVDGNIINSYTITTNNGMDISEPTSIEQYADGGNTLSKWFSGEELTQWENSHLAPVQFKLLIPPINEGSSRDIPKVILTYTFGKNINSVTTFYRNVDLSGVYNPVGNTNRYAVRDSESITLNWDINMVDYKTFKLFDVASGFKMHNVNMFVNNDDKLKNYFTNLSNDQNVDYDLSTNVVQVYLISNDYTINIDDPNFKKADALKKLLILSTTDSQYYTVKITPETFIPYRYYNGEIINKFTDSSDNESYNPLDISSLQTFYFNPSKYTTIQNNNGYINGNNTDAEIILPTTQNLFDSNGLIITSGIDVSFNLVYSGDILSQGTNPVILNRFKSSTQSIPSLTIQPFPTKNKILNTSIPHTITLRPIPTTIDLNQYFLQDYWKWIPSVCRSDKINNASDGPNQTHSYKYYNIHNQISSFIQPVDVTLNVGSILINTRYQQSGFMIKPFPCSDDSCEYNSNSPVLDIVGGLDVTPPISSEPFTPFMYLEPTPSNPTNGGILNSQETPWEGQTFVQDGGGDAYVQISPPINSVPFIWNENADEDGWNSGSFVELFKAKETYPSLTTRQERLRWNQLYNLKIKGVNIATTDGSPIWYNNPNYLGIPVAPVNGVKVNCVELWPAVLKNKGDIVNDSSNLVTLKWDSYFFDPSTQGDACWTVTRENIATGEKVILLDDSPITPINYEYIFRDTDVKVYDKLFYTVTGVFKWQPESSDNYLTLPIQGFSTNTIFVCKNNKFQYGRYNTTSTNLKLYRPLLIRQPGGQCDNNNNCVGGACRGLVNGKMETLYVPNSKIQSSNNIYANTSNQLTQKQIYVLLAKANYRPFR